MLKLAGAALVLAAGAWAGLTIAATYAERTRGLRTWQTALGWLRTEMLYASSPLPEALDRVIRQLDEIGDATGCGRVLGRVRARLESGRGLTGGEAWREALAAEGNDPGPGWSLTRSDVALLLEFGQALGTSDREDQARHFTAAVERLAAEERRARQEQDRQERLWRYAGLLMGALVVLILY